MHQTKAWWPWVATLLLSFIACSSSDSASNGSEAVGSVTNELAAAPTAQTADPLVVGFDEAVPTNSTSDLGTVSTTEASAEETSPLSLELPGGRAEVCSEKLSVPWKRSDTVKFQLWMEQPTAFGDVRVILRPATSGATQVELAPVAIHDKPPGVFHPIVSSVESEGPVVGADAPVRICIVINAEPGRYLVDDFVLTYPPTTDESNGDTTPSAASTPADATLATLSTGDTAWPQLTIPLTDTAPTTAFLSAPTVGRTPTQQDAEVSIDQGASRGRERTADVTAGARKAGATRAGDTGAPSVAFFELDDPDFCTTETLLPTAPFVSSVTPPPNGTTIPYPLCTAQQYAHLVATSNLWSSNFVLMADIDLSVLQPPPSTVPFTFGGVFEGNNHTLSNYTINSAVSAGVLGKLGPTGVIRNLVLRDFDVSGVNHVGALVWENRGLIEHVTGINLTASGTATGIGVNIGIAGVVGINYGTLSDITASVDVTAASGVYSIGGLVGRQGRAGLGLSGFLIDGNVSGTVTRLAGPPSTESLYTGGAVGLMEQGSVANTHAAINLASPLGRVGGLVGQSRGPIVGSSASGPVTSAGGSVGGLVGVNTGIIQGSFSTGSVSGTNSVGGLAGLADGNSNISDSYATGTVQGTADGVGGLCGRNTGAISTSYAMGPVQGVEMVGGLVGYLRTATSSVIQSWATGTTSATGDDAGGLVGLVEGQVDASYARGAVTGSTHVGGLVGTVDVDGGLQDCASTANTVSGVLNVGGLIGNLDGSVERCFATANVTGDTKVGGLIGVQTGNVTDSYATGSVTANVAKAGGLVGHLRLTATVLRAYSAGGVAGASPLGGFAGDVTDDSSLEDCHFNATENPGLSAVGTNPGATGVVANSDAALRQEDTFWDFEEVWGILEGFSYPFLQPIPSCAEDGCGLSCPCPADTCTTESDCAFGQTCGESNGGYFDEGPDADVCWDPLCETDQREALCGAPEAPCGACEEVPGACTSDMDCPTGSVCGENNGGYLGLPADSGVCWDAVCDTTARSANCGTIHDLCGRCAVPGCSADSDCPSDQVCGLGAGLFFDYAAVNVCWDAVCQTAQADNCGDGALCGKCACIPDCSGKTCGDDASDGCGGVCQGFCNSREGGCNADYECPAGTVCVPDGGPRIGLPDGTNVCLPAECIDNDLSAMDCGEASSTCGECPSCVSACEGRACGADPSGCAVDCGTCSSGSCVDGQCVEFESSVLVIPDEDGNPVEVSPLPDQATEEIGATPATFAVNERGAATYDIPIEVPPSPAGLQPELSIRYASTAHNGYLGVGWSVGGLSQITRCNSNRRFDSWPGPVRMSDSDKFCLDGRRLVAEANYGQDGTEYYVVPEDFSKVVSYGRSGQGPESFKVWTRDGRTLYYGATAQARQRNFINSTVRSWLLNRIADRAGNVIDIQYTRHGAAFTECSIDVGFVALERSCEDREIAPASIYYGGFDRDGVTRSHQNEVVFHYSEADRPDKLEGFLPGGGTIERTKLLQSIETRARNEHVRSYEFFYNDDDDEPSLLEELRECAGEGASKSCKPPTSFEYNGSGGGFGPPIHTGYQVAQLDGEDVSVLGWHVFDMSGDGRDDALIEHAVPSGSPPWLAYISDPGAGERVFYEMETNTFARMRDPDDPRLLLGKPITLPGDARRDMYTGPRQASGGHYRTAKVTSITFPSVPSQRGALTFWQEALARRNVNWSGPYLFDIDGDGYEDPTWCELAGDTWVFEGRIDGQFAPKGAAEGNEIGLPRKACAHGVAGLDLDADGFPNIVRRQDAGGAGVNWRALLTSGYDAATNVVDGEWVVPAPIGDGGLRGIDANGDGLQDLLYHRTQLTAIGDPHGLHTTENLGFRADLFINTGRGTWVPSGRFVELNDEEFVASVVVDYNGDGNEDLLYPMPPPAARDEWAVVFGGPVPFTNAHYPLNLGVDRPRRAISKDFSTYAHILEEAEVDGDSSKDLLMIDAEGKLVVLRGLGGRSNLLKRVTDGLGKRYDVAYEPDTSAGRTYTVGENCTVSAMCVSDPGPLVSGYTISQAKGVDPEDASSPPDLGEAPAYRQRRFEFRYTDARRDGQGYGWLGFGSRTIREYDGVSNLIQDTKILYHNEPTDRSCDWQAPFDPALTQGASAYAFVGKPKEITTTTSAALSSIEEEDFSAFRAERTRVTNCWTLKQGRLSTQSVPSVEYRTTEFYDVFVPFLGSDVERQMHRINESFDFDEYGNQLSYLRQEGRYEGESWLLLAEQETLTTPRPPDEEAWLVALPQETSTTDWMYPGFDEHTRTTQFVYYDSGLLQNIIREPDDEYYRVITTFGRDEFNNVDLLTVADADPDTSHRQTRFVYDEEGIFPTEIENSLGHITRVVYDARFGTPSLVADPNNVVHRFAYDGFGRLRLKEKAGETTIISFKDYLLHPNEPLPVRGAMAVEQNTVNGPKETTVVDSFGRPVEVQRSGLQGTRVDQEIAYNAAGLPERITRPHLATDPTSQGIIELAYDVRQRLIAETYPDETVIEYSYANRMSLALPEIADEQPVTALHYQWTKDREGNVTVNAADFRGNLNAHYYDYSLEERTLYQYAGFGVLTYIEDSFGNVTRDVPDRYGRITTQSDPDRGTTTNTYTAFDQVATSIDARDISNEYTYDRLGRLRFHLNSRDGVVQWAYDGNDGSGGQPNAIGHLTYASREGDDHITQFRYEPYDGVNNRGLLAAIDRTISTESGPREFTTSFEYDDASRLELIHYPSAGSDASSAAPLAIRYHYDAHGNLEEMSDDATSEPYWQLVSESQGYRIDEHKLGGNINGSIRYNPLNGNITEVSYSGQQLLDRSTYTYDDNRNLEGILKPDGASTTFGYDNLNRMTSVVITDADGNSQFQEYIYDPIGRLLDKSGVGTYTYDDADRPHAVKSAGDYTFEYEPNGNTISRKLVGEDKRTYFQYMGAFGLPYIIDHLTGEEGPRTELEYGPFTERVVKRQLAADDTLESEQLYVGDEFEVTEHADGSIDYVSNIFLGQTQIARVLRTEQDGILSDADVEYMLLDRQGTPNVVANANGTVRRTNSFSPYGAPQNGDLEGAGFTGHRHDLESDLIDMRGRLYDPVVAKFMSPDPIVSDAHLSEGLNPYSYVFNSPMNWVDPSGFEASSGDAASYSYPTGCSDCSSSSGASGYSPLGPTDANGNPTTTSDPGMAADMSPSLAGTPTMPSGAGSWSPGSAQTGDVVPSEGTPGGMSDTFGGYNQLNSSIEFSQLSPPPGTENQAPALAGGPVVVLIGVAGCLEVPLCAAGLTALAILTYQGLVNVTEAIVQASSKPQPTAEKVPKTGGKAGATDVPSWAKGFRPLVAESGKDFAKRILDGKYGPGSYPTGPGSEFNKIQKWGDRHFVDP